MQTTAYKRNLAIAGLMVLGCSLPTACKAQLTLWLKADSSQINLTAPASGDPVSLWKDASGSGLDVSASGTAQPTFLANQLNGFGAVRFDGVANELDRTPVTASSLVSADQSATFLVLKPNAQDANTILSWVDNTAGAGNFLQVAENAGKLAYAHGQVLTAPIDAITADKPGNWIGNWHILSLVRHSDGSGEIHVDGTALATSGAFTGPLNSAPGTLSVAHGFGADNWGGDIAELRVYNSGSVDTSAIETELGTKFNLAPVPEPSQYATVFAAACVCGALFLRNRRQASAA